MATFKVGDKVRIKRTCKADRQYDGLTLFEHMMFDGVATITSIDGRQVHVEEQPYIYRAAMFELAEEPKKVTHFKVGDRVRIKASCKVDKNYGGITLLDAMMFDGIRTIETIDFPVIELKEDAVKFAYTEQMFEKADVTKYKVGDRVRVRKDIEEKRYYMDTGGAGWNTIDSMVRLAGRVVTIAKTAFNESYRIKEASCAWTDEMFEGLVEESPAPAPAPKKPNGKFNIGDRVRCTYNFDGADIKGKTGTIKYYDSDCEDYAVEFDEPVTRKGRVDGHECGGVCKSQHGWFVKKQYLELAIFEEFKEAVDLTFDNPLIGLTHLVNPPKMTSIERTKCVVASSTYPYAVMETDGLFFYADIPVGCTYFETIKVLECAYEG